METIKTRKELFVMTMTRISVNISIVGRWLVQIRVAPRSLESPFKGISNLYRRIPNKVRGGVDL